ncbi:MAG: Type III pantothenate kinase [Alphaproteobacteria bacterium ADurb.BinA280]|nr:type III pantothenate kinase [Aquimonas sp.]OPZ13250.1 MAG: Type III pantothenate kinase [Alphaproteobacteria bacterium ADurb.BinA280]
MSNKETWLLFDAGNTRLKWAHVRADGIEETSAIAWPALAVPHGRDALPSVSPDQHVVLAQVLAPDRAAALQLILAQRYGEFCELHTEAAFAGLRSGYRHPQRLGVDRWLAMLAAWNPGDALLLANVGTALTLDAVDSQGQHLGGTILGGLDAMQRGLLQAAPGLQRWLASDDGERSLWADDSAMAIRSAPAFAAAGIIELAARRLQRQLGVPVRCVIAGGDASAVQARLDIDSELRRDLVLEGMWKRVRLA